MQIISVIGPNDSNSTDEIFSFGIWLGKTILDLGCRVACGGMGGIMEAVCKGARLSSNYTNGATIGIIPSANKSAANRYCDIVIPTGIGLARNFVVVNTGDIIVAVAGGPGTLSEIAFALQLNKRVVCYTGFPGWTTEIAQNPLLDTHYNHISLADNPDELKEMLEMMVG